MSRSQRDFFTPHQMKGRPAAARFGLRREPETKKPQPPADKTTFSYGSPGRGVNGESSN